MLFLVPGDPGENYWRSLFDGRFRYGVVSFLLSIAAFGAVGWLWSSPGAPLRRLLTRAFALGVGALFWVVLIIIADLRLGQ